MTYRSIGGIFDFYIFTGPKVEAVTQQMTYYIGRAPLFPYWSLGFQLCRYGYDKIENVVAVVEENRAMGIPHDTQVHLLPSITVF